MTELRKKSIEPKDYTSLLANFLSGKLGLSDLRDTVNDRLFELRTRSSRLTEEEKFLSGIELVICEIEDGFRTVDDLEEYIRTLIRREKAVPSQRSR